MTLRAVDEKQRDATTTFYRWATGTDWVPWDDESRLKVDVIPDRTSYVVGDTATVLFASPFTGAEAWITVEREGLIEQRRMTLTSGSTTLKFPITESYAPNAFISIFIARGTQRTAGSSRRSGAPDDSRGLHRASRHARGEAPCDRRDARAQRAASG